MVIKENVFSMVISLLVTLSLLLMLSLAGNAPYEESTEYVILNMDKMELVEIPPKEKKEEPLPIIKKEKIVEVKPDKIEPPPEKVPEEIIEEKKPEEPPPPQPEAVVVENTIQTEIEVSETVSDAPTVEIAAVPEGNYREGEKTIVPTTPIVSENTSPVVTTQKPAASPSYIDIDEIVDANTQGVEFKVISEFKPKYPEAAKEFEIEASVVVKVLVGYDGKIEKIEFLKSFEEFGFNDAVRDTLKYSRYSFKKNGKKVRGYHVIPFSFTHEN